MFLNLTEEMFRLNELKKTDSILWTIRKLLAFYNSLHILSFMSYIVLLMLSRFLILKISFVIIILQVFTLSFLFKCTWSSTLIDLSPFLKIQDINLVYLKWCEQFDGAFSLKDCITILHIVRNIILFVKSLFSLR